MLPNRRVPHKDNIECSHETTRRACFGRSLNWRVIDLSLRVGEQIDIAIRRRVGKAKRAVARFLPTNGVVIVDNNLIRGN